MSFPIPPAAGTAAEPGPPVRLWHVSLAVAGEAGG
jgi:hypothetical protein